MHLDAALRCRGGRRRWTGVSRRAPLLLAVLVAAARALPAQEPAGAAGTAALVVEASLPDDGYVSRDEVIELRFNRPLTAGERVVVFVDEADLTDLFRNVPGGMRYAPQIVLLPAGESELAVHLVTADGEWQEVGRFPLRVRGSLGFEHAGVSPGVDLGVEAQLAEGHEPEGGSPSGYTYQELTGQLSLESEAVRGRFRTMVQGAAIGVSDEDRALRFGELGDEAPKLDLSSYLIRADYGPSSVSLGHISMGRQRHLVSGFSSRGLKVDLKTGSRLDFSGVIANGSSIVGWDNFLGIDESDHRILSGTLGLEVLRQPGLLRVEVSGMDGSVLPLAGYNQGVVNDAEESKGFGFSLQASDPSGRLRLEGGFARSTFTNPDDPELSQGEDIVAVQEVTRNARYLEASLDVLRSVPLGSTRSASLGLSYGHERVDPLYRSLAAFTAADQMSHRWGAQADIAGVGVQLSYARSEDNLNDVPSILKTLTRRSSANIAAPLGNVVGSYSPWLPTIAWSFDRTHQYGDDLPTNGGFSPSHVPDQESLNQDLNASWQFDRLSFSYRLGLSKQDNRQEGRENADFKSTNHAIAADVQALASVSIGLTYDHERAENQESGEIDRTRRLGARGSWMPYGGATLSLSVTGTLSEDDAQTREQKDTRFDAQWSSGIPGLTAFGVQYYVRFSRGVNDAVDGSFGLDSHNENWSVNTGLNLRFF